MTDAERRTDAFFDLLVIPLTLFLGYKTSKSQLAKGAFGIGFVLYGLTAASAINAGAYAPRGIK